MIGIGTIIFLAVFEVIFIALVLYMNKKEQARLDILLAPVYRELEMEERRAAYRYAILQDEC